MNTHFSFKTPVFRTFFFSFLVFVAMLALVLSHQVFSFIDPMFLEWIDGVSSPSVLTFLISFTNMAGSLTFALVSLLFFLFLVMKKDWYHGLLLVSSLLSGSILFLLIKFLFHIERPLGQLIPETGFSFPSGHSTLAAIFFSVLFLSFQGKIKNKYSRGVFGLVCVFFVFLVGFSRIFLHVHRLSDVLAGFSLGIVVVSFFSLILPTLFSIHGHRKTPLI